MFIDHVPKCDLYFLQGWLKSGETVLAYDYSKDE